MTDRAQGSVADQSQESGTDRSQESVADRSQKSGADRPRESPGGHSQTATASEESHPPLRRNWAFVRLFLGQFVTNAGDSLYSVAVVWLVFELSGSSVLVGVTNALLLLPFLLQAVGGPIVDRYSVTSVLVGSQLLQGSVVLVLPLAAYAGYLNVGVILLVVPVLALSTVVMAPAQTSLLPRIVADDQLSRGNSALSTVTLGLDMVFDALGGLFVALLGATTLFLVDAATFALAGLLFAGIAVPENDTEERDETEGSDDTEEREGDESRPPDESAASVLAEYVEDLREGVAILRGSLFVEMVLATAVTNFAVGVTLATLPAFGDALGGPAVYGLLLGALGVGRLLGSAVASWLDGVPYGRLVVTTYSASTLLWLGSVVAPSTALTVVLFGLAWVTGGINGVLVSTLNQTVFPSEVLGRVSSIKGTVATATLPVGSLFGGVLAESLGPTTTMGLAALGFGFFGLYVLARPPLRRLPAVEEADPSDLRVRIDRTEASTDE